MTDLLEQELMALHQRNQPDAAFINQLEQTLRNSSAQRQPAIISPKQEKLRIQPTYRHLGLVAASIVIIFALVAAVEPLQTWAQEIFDFFIHSEITDSTQLVQHDQPEFINVESITQAEEIAGFEALKWQAEHFNPIFILAAEGRITLVYEHKNDRGPLVIVSKTRNILPHEPEPVRPDATIINTKVNEYVAQFVAGWWHTPRDESTQWSAENQRLLHWQDDHFSYSLTVSSYIADTLDEVVELAESLR
ncbi:hypothetical protein G4Y79_13215 [Phototrophicus methaneseepsis]|uniref:DUF4367 domain-containing protein n=1 Tax=Phototrophicus methaneseepsis TaxID=2710758 RepID=A0A7S8E5C1_9CHLR|nr:hypothetical protein [Phototrophicus methaneseepsis]QPC80672.1 hypothetical protein G4Y79_13215 [Phototrophicus methaneseepsis]